MFTYTNLPVMQNTSIAHIKYKDSSTMNYLDYFLPSACSPKGTSTISTEPAPYKTTTMNNTTHEFHSTRI